jgi:Amt family ammonium transporter
MSAIFWLALKATVGIRVHAEQEFIGLDIAEHGMEAYTGFMKEPDAFGSNVPSGMVDSEPGIHGKL